MRVAHVDEGADVSVDRLVEGAVLRAAHADGDLLDAARRPVGLRGEHPAAGLDRDAVLTESQWHAIEAVIDLLSGLLRSELLAQARKLIVESRARQPLV